MHGWYVTVQQPVQEMLSQLANKDLHIIELDSEIQQLHQTITDLRERISEKDEVIRSRDQAVQIMRDMQAGIESNSFQEAGSSDEQPAVTQVDSSAELQLQRQLQETSELLTAREESVNLLREELHVRNQHIAELSSHLSNFQSNYAILEASRSDLEKERSAAVAMSAELATRITEVEAVYNDLLTKQTSLEQNRAALEQYCIAAQASCTELNQRYVAVEESYLTLQQRHTALESSFTQLQVTHLELEQAHTALVENHSKLQNSVTGNVEEAGAAVHEPMSSQPTEQQQECDQLRASLADCESRFSKFKSLAGSKIKALENELAELHEVIVDELSVKYCGISMSILLCMVSELNTNITTVLL